MDISCLSSSVFNFHGFVLNNLSGLIFTDSSAAIGTVAIGAETLSETLQPRGRRRLKATSLPTLRPADTPMPGFKKEFCDVVRPIAEFAANRAQLSYLAHGFSSRELGAIAHKRFKEIKLCYTMR